MAENLNTKEALKVNLARLQKASTLTKEQMAQFQEPYKALCADTARLVNELFVELAFCQLVSRQFIDEVGGTKWAMDILDGYKEKILCAVWQHFSYEELETIFVEIDNKFQSSLWKKKEYYVAKENGEMYHINPLAPQRFQMSNLKIVS